MPHKTQIEKRERERERERKRRRESVALIVSNKVRSMARIIARGGGDARVRALIPPRLRRDRFFRDKFTLPAEI